jgi:hypothetical protein
MFASLIQDTYLLADLMAMTNRATVPSSALR